MARCQPECLLTVSVLHLFSSAVWWKTHVVSILNMQLTCSTMEWNFGKMKPFKWFQMKFLQFPRIWCNSSVVGYVERTFAIASYIHSDRWAAMYSTVVAVPLFLRQYLNDSAKKMFNQISCRNISHVILCQTPLFSCSPQI